MTRIDTVRGIAAHCRRSHGAALLAAGWLVIETPTETLEQLLEALGDSDGHVQLLDHVQAYAAAMQERYGTSSRLD